MIGGRWWCFSEGEDVIGIGIGWERGGEGDDSGEVS